MKWVLIVFIAANLSEPIRTAPAYDTYEACLGVGAYLLDRWSATDPSSVYAFKCEKL